MDYVNSFVLILSLQSTIVDSKPDDKTPCIESSTRIYKGTLNVTLSGFGCQAWSSQTPHEHTRNLPSMFPADASVEDAKNYCRDTEDEGRLWCYTLNPARRWEYCNIEPCNSEDLVQQTNVNVLQCQEIAGELVVVNCPLIFCATSTNMVPLASYTGDVSSCSYVCCTTDDFAGSNTEMSSSTVTWIPASVEPAKPTTASSAFTSISEGITGVTLEGDQFVTKSANRSVDAAKTTPSSASMFITERITDAEHDVTKSLSSYATTMPPVNSVSTLVSRSSTLFTPDAEENVTKSVNHRDDMITVPTISNDEGIDINESVFPKMSVGPAKVSTTFPTFSFTSQTWYMSWSTTFSLFPISPVSNRPTPPLQTFILTSSPVSSPPSSTSEVTIHSFTNTKDNDVPTNDTDEEFSAINTNRAADDKDIGISANDTVKHFSANDTDKDISANDADKAIYANDTGKGISANDTNKDISAYNTDKDISAHDTDKAISANDTDKAISANDTDKDISAHDTDKAISANDTDKAISANDTDKNISAHDTNEAISANDTDEAISANDTDEAISDHNIRTSISTNDTDKGLSTKYTDIFSNDTVNDGQESTNSTDFDGLISSTETLHLALLEDLSLSISYLVIFTFYLLILCNVLVFP